MYAATATMVFDHLDDLVRRQAQEAEQRVAGLVRWRSPLEAALSSLQIVDAHLRRVARVPGNLVAALLAKWVDGAADNMVRMSLGFKGLRSHVEEEPRSEPIDPERELGALLDKLVEDMLAIGDSTASLVATLEGRRSTRAGLLRAFKRMAIATGAVRDEVVALQGALLAHDLRCGLFADHPAFGPLQASIARMESTIERLADDDTSDLDPALLEYAKGTLKVD